MLTTLKLGIQMLRAIEAVHDLGYLHRDVKPSNYAMGLSPAKRHSCFLIDFGLSRRFVMPNGEVRPVGSLAFPVAKGVLPAFDPAAGANRIPGHCALRFNQLAPEQGPVTKG